MEWWQILLVIILCAAWFVPMVYELLVIPLREYVMRVKRNKEWNSIHGKRLRMRCLDCKYCKTFLYHPFYKYGPYGNVCVQKLPSYCRKLKRRLDHNADLRCIAKENSFAMFE